MCWLFAGKAVCGEMKSRIARSKRMVVLAIRIAGICKKGFTLILWYDIKDIYGLRRYNWDANILCTLSLSVYNHTYVYIICNDNDMYIYIYLYIYMYACIRCFLSNFAEEVLVPGCRRWLGPFWAAVGGVCVCAMCWHPDRLWREPWSCRLLRMLPSNPAEYCWIW